MSEIYQPAEDSFLLSEFVKKEIEGLQNKNIKILDMGSGSGIQAQTCIEGEVKPQNITIVDIDPKAVKFLKDKFSLSKIILSNLFSRIPKTEKFDLMIFNPPYLPEDKFDMEGDTTGGEKGSEIINEFLEQSRKYLSKNGKILLLTSSFTKKINWHSYDAKKLGKKRVFFEELYVWELK
ncbi:MAG TPA: HemK2/MTQ2 family protein methyltransferase [Candidatus Omnitrophota bacterium]|nr:HemK2/MTQ2 family protein methyltransferase [Candidatus Omnitrophota bacterium]